MRFLAILGLLAVGAVLSFTSIGLASAFYLWHNIFRPLNFAWAEGSLPTAQLVIVLLIASYFLNLLRRKFKPRFTVFFWLTMIFMGWVWVCGYLTIRTPPAYMNITTMEGVILIAKYLGPIALISTCLVTMADVRLAVLTMTLSVATWGAWLGLGGIRYGVNPKMCIPGGQLSERNYFAAAVACVMPLLLYFAKSYRGRYPQMVRWGLLAMFVMNGAVIVFSGSRGAVVAVVGMIVLFVAVVSDSKIKHGILILILGAIVYSVLPDSFFKRMETIDLSAEQTEGSAKERTLLMRSAYRCTLDHPLFGVGPICWEAISPAYTGLRRMMQPHSMWLLCSAETGWPGLAMLVLILLITVFRLLRLARRARLAGDMDRSTLAKALVVSILGYSIGLTFLNHYYMELWWGLLAAANCLCSLPERRRIA